MLPERYLHGLSSGDFELAMRGLLGDAAPLSASSMARRKARWELEFDEWKKRDRSGLAVVYGWADGLYVKAGIEESQDSVTRHRCRSLRRQQGISRDGER
jgi:hypothetical protein